MGSYITVPAHLADRIQLFLESTIEQSHKLARLKGELLSEVVKPYHHELKNELSDSSGLTLFAEGHFSQFGGERLKVWYHPGAEKSDETFVLDVEWWNRNQFNIVHFDYSPDWQAALVALVLFELEQIAA
jgi:hypothetical protein